MPHDTAAPAPLIAVVGATGRQGGAVARHLLAAGLRVRAITRQPSGHAARSLADLGAELVRADMERPATLDAALEGASGVFSVQNYWERGVGFAGEVRQGTHLMLAARRAGVRHFIQSSVAQAGDAPQVHHFACKAQLEQALRGHGLPATVLDTVFFMENLVDARTGPVVLAMLARILGPDQPLHMLAVDDIGVAAAKAFQAPDAWIGKQVNLAGDRLTVPEIQDALRRAGEPSAPGLFHRALARVVAADLRRQLAWNRTRGWTFGVDEAQALVDAPTRFGDFLQRRRAGAAPG